MVLRAAALSALLCASCASASGLTGTRGATPASPDAAQLATGIAAADADMYANRYAAAGAAFASLLVAAPRSADVRAADALFLNYEGDAGAAGAEAIQAVALDAHDADAQAVLCRVDDWAGNIIDAVERVESSVVEGTAQIRRIRGRVRLPRGPPGRELAAALTYG